MLRATPIADLVTSLWGDPQIWFMYEQVFLKDGGENRRTPWHQDASYLNVDGDHLAVVWITFEPVAQQDCLEFVRGSHRGTLYNTSAFNADDETMPIFDGLPRLPDIEADRAAFDIVSWAIDPGDVLVFHPACSTEARPPTRGNVEARSACASSDVMPCTSQRPAGGGPRVDGLHQRLVHGAPFRDPAFPELTASRSVSHRRSAVVGVGWFSAYVTCARTNWHISSIAVTASGASAPLSIQAIPSSGKRSPP